MKAIKSLLKPKRGVQYSLNLEYHIERAIGSEDWYLYVALFTTGVGLFMLWNIMASISNHY